MDNTKRLMKTNGNIRELIHLSDMLCFTLLGDLLDRCRENRSGRTTFVCKINIMGFGG